MSSVVIRVFFTFIGKSALMTMLDGLPIALSISSALMPHGQPSNRKANSETNLYLSKWLAPSFAGGYLSRRGMKSGFRRNGMQSPYFSTCKAIIVFFSKSPHPSRAALAVILRLYHLTCDIFPLYHRTVSPTYFLIPFGSCR